MLQQSEDYKLFSRQESCIFALSQTLSKISRQWRLVSVAPQTKRIAVYISLARTAEISSAWLRPELGVSIRIMVVVACWSSEIVAVSEWNTLRPCCHQSISSIIVQLESKEPKRISLQTFRGATSYRLHVARDKSNAFGR